MLLRNIHRFLTRPSFGALRRIEPFARDFGFSRGKPIDRFYIENFLKAHSASITGEVLEIGDDQYTRMFGHNLSRSCILNADCDSSDSLNGDLSSIQTIEPLIGKFDCVIATQVLNFIFDVDAAIANLHLLLRPGGVVLATVAGLVQISRFDADRWGDYWRFNDRSISSLFSPVFGDEQVKILRYGNVLAAMGVLQGLCSEDFTERELVHVDNDYQVLIGVRGRRLSVGE